MKLLRVKNTIINLDKVCQVHYYTPTEDDVDKDRELIIWLENKETEHFYGDEADFVWLMFCENCKLEMPTKERKTVFYLSELKVEA